MDYSEEKLDALVMQAIKIQYIKVLGHSYINQEKWTVYATDSIIFFALLVSTRCT